jgi:hypothetical protein
VSPRQPAIVLGAFKVIAFSDSLGYLVFALTGGLIVFWFRYYRCPSCEDPMSTVDDGWSFDLDECTRCGAVLKSPKR